MSGRPWIGAGVLAVASLIVVAVGALAPASSLAAECTNEAIRKEQGSTFLPECRAYELVSPPEAAVEYLASAYVPQVPNVPYTVGSASGERVAYFSYAPPEGDASAGFQFLATRGNERWSTVNAVPPQSVSTGEPGCPPEIYIAPELTSNLLTDGGWVYDGEGLRAFCATNEPGLAPNEPGGGFANIFRHDWATGAYETVNLTPAGVAPGNAVLEDASPDQSDVVFAESAELVPGAPKGFDLYESAEGHVRLITYLPDGNPAAGSIVDGVAPSMREGHLQGPDPSENSAAPFTHAESESGERVFFTSGGSLYMREHASHAPTASGACSPGEPEGACTVQIDAKQGGSEEGGGTFLYASADGSRVFFMDERHLTADATAKPEEPDLYEYDAEAPEGQRLKDLTVHPGEPADVQGVTAGSEDGSYLYFVADGRLTEDPRAVRGRPNLYVAHEGALRFVARLNPQYDRADWAWSTHEVSELRATTSPSGKYVAFESVERLTGYDNEPAKEGECRGLKSQSSGPCPEVFRYSAGEGALVCASCDPKGARPTGPAGLQPVSNSAFGAKQPVYHLHQVLEDGKLFFTSPDRLVEADKNENFDVYEYGAGGPRLISSGTAEGPAEFAEASANAENVFFVTSQPLVAADTGGTPSLYDARVDGGFEAQSAQPPPEECVGANACRRPLPEPPVEAFGASAAFNGPGDLAPSEMQTQELPVGKREVKAGGGHGLTRAQKLKRALKRCRRRHGGMARRRCRTRARRGFARHRKRRRQQRREAPHGRGHGKRKHGRGRR